MKPTVLEICAGGGGQALGLERAGFAHAGAVEMDTNACATLRANRPGWDVLTADVREVSGTAFRGVDLLAGGVPCPPFSIAGQQLGAADERDLIPEALRLLEEIRPRALMLENVRGLAGARFTPYLGAVLGRISALGYVPAWRILNACDFGVPQLRPRFVLVALRPDAAERFRWPLPSAVRLPVGLVLADLMAARQWAGADAWAERARDVAPTLVGGSKKHGGADLGPTRARAAWAALGVDGRGLADAPPGPDFPTDGMPRLTVRMAALVQGFPDEWVFSGRKTAAYRQIGNAFPPPVACAVGRAIIAALEMDTQSKRGHSARERGCE